MYRNELNEKVLLNSLFNINLQMKQASEEVDRKVNKNLMSPTEKLFNQNTLNVLLI